MYQSTGIKELGEHGGKSKGSRARLPEFTSLPHCLLAMRLGQAIRPH